jgi:DNA-binding GntR family transcriptional regulator
MKSPRPDSGALLGDVAYESVREAIRAGHMKPGERISEYKVAEWLNVSRTPAREALRRLENEGLLASHPRRGLIVASVDDEAIFELYAAREILEGAAAALAAQRATDAEVAALEHLVDAEELIVDDPQRMYEHNRVFHSLLYRAAHNRYMLKFLTAMTDTLSAHRSTSTLVEPARRRAVVAEHRALIESIAARDEKGARQAAVKHIKSALRARTKVHHAQLVDEVGRLSGASDKPTDPAASGS